MARGVASLLVFPSRADPCSSSWLGARVGRDRPGLCAALLFWLLALLGGSAVAAGPARALPEDDARGRAHFAAGQEYFEQGRFPEAASEFSEAYQLSGRPEMLINRARAEARAGMLEQAVASLELLLERYPQTSYREEAEQELASLRAELEQPKPPETPETPETRAAPPAPVLAPAPSVPRERALKLWPPRLPTLIVGGVLVASVLVSVGTGWAAHAKYERLDQRCPAGQCPDDDGRHADQRDQDQGRTLARTSTGFTFLSIALGAATALLWAYDVKAQRSQLALGFGASAGGAGAQLRWVH
jgi:tetratricopeptide (TPR) repeat protein